ncbi:MAG: hybrid sensor histidine kinase/response regulator [Cyanobacteriota bacterium]|nr:hybrid sensor histidine kinase/response regulator [Cyanobacteriota bacterium]
MIEDRELREVFKIACEEHLQKLDEGFLYLEKHPQDSATLEELLREAHSVKGDAGMLGAKDVSTLAHQMEHILGAVQRGEQEMSSDLSDRLFQGLDALGKLVREAVTGEPSGVNTFYVLANLMGSMQQSEATETEDVTGEEESEEEIEEIEEIEETEEINTPPVAVAEETEETGEVPGEEVPETPAVAEKTAQRAREESGHGRQRPRQRQDKAAASERRSPPPAETPTPVAARSRIPSSGQESYRIETIRVPTRNLDALMTEAGELTVTKIRLAHRLTEIEEITKIWEEWSRDIFKNRFIVDDLNNKNKGNFQNGAIAELQSYHRRLEEGLENFGVLVNGLRNSLLEDTARLDLITDELEEGIKTLRLLPLSTIFNLFPRMVRDLARQQGKEIELIIEGGETKADKRILEEMKDPLMHMIRNAVDHGIETPEERLKSNKSRAATIRLKGYQTASNVVIEAIDDGRGLDLERIKKTAIKRGVCSPEDLESMTTSQIQSLIFAPGFSTRTFVTEVSGRGVGLDVVRSNVEALKGSIEVQSNPGKGSIFRVQLSTSLATAHVLIVEVNNVSYALPLELVQTTILVSNRDIFPIEGRETIIFENRPLSVARLADLLEIATEIDRENTDEDSQLSCVVLKVGEERLGLFVDRLVDEQDVVLKPQSNLLKRIRNIAGATILGTGEVCMVLNPQDLVKSVRKLTGVSKLLSAPEISLSTDAETSKQPTILLAEDSIATRTQEKRILENAGYEVVTAVDGLDAFNKLKNRSFDVVISDVQMPNLDGLGLTAKIRENKQYSELPIILVTSLASDEDKRRGADAGASAYITKGNFNQEVLLETLTRLV